MSQPSRLERVAADIWIAEGPVVSFYGFPYPTRSVIVRLPNGALWVWSPIPLDDALMTEVSGIGPVAHLISPNKLHHLGLADWRAAFPAARLWGLPSTVRKRRDLRFDGVLEDTPPDAWQGTLDHVMFRGSPLLDEMMFFHRPSRTVLLADLSEALSREFLVRRWAPWQRFIARLWSITEAAPKAPLEVRLSTIRRRAARAAIQRLLAYDPENVIMAHGAWQRGHGRAFLERTFSWLSPEPPQALGDEHR
ncbi:MULTISPECIES: DUF4336 domain-containing protein [unclassified Modicisalibacter]|uniref:DUF4336 domain-containing protein n=1 Tax=unclassified Modicisalibacter TaxID=2679913 RepID=UPI001CC9504E|nr:MULTISPECIES: DUF4336 domain-containing protein [unclassified Modicisalibacter]MBZ9556516.1 DUF4336 domain-containing protein [Modicisalibacter sp. R2A 31.J]MBZ9575015.1 DUF4336 domain-containing protein [Modicisalibacter sp. MOD 31.J]